jgi:hypothetical protein
VILITDSNIGAGLPAGVYDTPWGYPVKVSPTDAARHATKGFLAGSALTMDRGMANLLRWLKLPARASVGHGHAQSRPPPRTCAPGPARPRRGRRPRVVGRGSPAARTWVGGVCTYARRVGRWKTRLKSRSARFTFEPAACIPFRDTTAIARVRAIKRRDLAKHRNPDYRITIVPDAELEHRWITDMFFRISEAMAAGRRYVMIMPNPWPGYAKLASMLNRARVDCRRLHTFNMDEYADQDGRIAPATWEFGFGYAFKKYFYAELDPKLRPPEKQITIFTDRNLKDYGRMLRTSAAPTSVTAARAGPGTSRSSSPTPRVRGHVRGVEADGPARVHAEPLHHRAEFPARLLRHERRPHRRAAEGRDDRPGRGDRREAPHPDARHHGRWLVRLMAAAHLTRLVLHGPVTPICARIAAPNLAHRRLGDRSLSPRISSLIGTRDIESWL